MEILVSMDDDAAGVIVMAEIVLKKNIRPSVVVDSIFDIVVKNTITNFNVVGPLQVDAIRESARFHPVDEKVGVLLVVDENSRPSVLDSILPFQAEIPQDDALVDPFMGDENRMGPQRSRASLDADALQNQVGGPILEFDDMLEFEGPEVEKGVVWALPANGDGLRHGRDRGHVQLFNPGSREKGQGLSGLKFLHPLGQGLPGREAAPIAGQVVP